MLKVSCYFTDDFPPYIIMDVAYLEVFVGKTFTLQFFAEDRNDDNVTFSLLSLIPNASITRGEILLVIPRARVV